MGLGSTTTFRSDYYLKLRAMRQDKTTFSHFAVQKKNEAGTIVNRKDEKEVSGYLLRLDHSTYDYEGVEQRVLNIFLIDGLEQFKVEVNIDSQLGRNVANTLLTLTEDVSKLYFRCYDKKNPKDGKTYAKIWIGKSEYKEDGLGWRFSLDDVKPLIKVVPDPKRPGKTITLNHDLNAMLWEKWLLLEKQLNPHYRAMDEERRKKEPKAVQAQTQVQPDDGELQHELDNMKEEDLVTAESTTALTNQALEDPTDDLPF